MLMQNKQFEYCRYAAEIEGEAEQRSPAKNENVMKKVGRPAKNEKGKRKVRILLK